MDITAGVCCNLKKMCDIRISGIQNWNLPMPVIPATQMQRLISERFIFCWGIIRSFMIFSGGMWKIPNGKGPEAAGMAAFTLAMFHMDGKYGIPVDPEKAKMY